MSDSPSVNHRVLVIDDNEAIHEDYRRILTPAQRAPAALDDLEASLFGQALAAASDLPSAPFELSFAGQGQLGCELARQARESGRPFAVAFVDMRMPPGWDGVETAQALWKVDPDVQIVICTAFSDYSWDEIVGRLGRTDRLLLLKKPFDRPEVWQLASALTEKWAAVADSRLQLCRTQELTDELRSSNSQLHLEIGERKVAEERLRRYAYHDSLTGLPNRVYLLDRLDQSLDRARRNPEYCFAVLFLDLDNFKLVNDSLGHDRGDQLLIQASQRIRTCLRSLDSVARLDDEAAARVGGDEFVIILDGISRPADAAMVAGRLLDTLSPPFDLEVQEVSVHASIGITIYDPRYARADDVLRDADTAMYRAKAAGKGRYAMFHPEMHAAARERLELENDLRRAIVNREFGMRFQPIVVLPEGLVRGFESLLRWRHPTRGLLGPEQFIGVAEESGLIVPIGREAIRQACRQLKDWSGKFPQALALTINVNVSARQLREPSFPHEVGAILKEVGIEGDRLNLEITESFIIDDFATAARTLNQLRDLGVGLHIDDFGTGYSSLSCLHRYPLDVVKVDREFTNTIRDNPTYAAVVQAIATLAHTIGMRVTVEGVENQEQMATIIQVGCDFAQGYYFAKPITGDECEALLRTIDTPLVPAVEQAPAQ